MSEEMPDEVFEDEPARPKPTRLSRRVVGFATAGLVSVVGMAFGLGMQPPSPLVSEIEEKGESPNLLRSDVMDKAPQVDYATLTQPPQKPEPVVITLPEPAPERAPLIPVALPVPAAPPPVQQAPLFQTQQKIVVEQKREPAEDPDAVARRRQLAQETEAALKSGFFANGQTPAPEPEQQTSDASGLLGAAGLGGRSEAAAADQRALTPPDQNLQGNKRRFASSQATGGVYVDKPYLQPLSPYEVKAGTIIPGALVTALNSDLPGNIIGRITENVYDTVSGRHVLIPQGTTVVGRYNSFVAYGQDRAQIVWDRLIMPNGRSIELEGMRGSDRAGASGLEDEVDHHIGRLVGAVALSTAISVVSNIATDDSRDGSLTDELGSAVAQESAQVGSDFVRRNSNIQPTIKVRPGWSFTIVVHKDLILDPTS